MEIKPKNYTENEVVEMILTLREELADLEHQQWANWENYRETAKDKQHKNGYSNTTVWIRQRETDYKDLTESEKDSDREYADKVIALINSKLMTPAGFRESIKKAGLMSKKFANATEEETEEEK